MEIVGREGSGRSRALRSYGGLVIGIAVFLVAAPMAFRQANSYDGFTMERVAAGLADHGNPLVRQVPDEFGLNTPYSGYGIGTSAVMAPLRLTAKAVRGDTNRSMNIADSLLIGATAFAIFETLRRRGVSHRLTLLTTVLVVAASPLLAYAVTDFSEPGLALMVALIVLGLDGVARQTRYASLGVGAAVGGAILFRTDSVVLIALPTAVALLMLSRRKPRDALLFGLGAAPFVVVWIWYNLARFGSAFSGGYRYQGFTHSFLKGMYGLTLSPGRGVFIYAPVLIVAFIVVPRLQGTDRILGLLAVSLLILRVLFYASWWSWYAGSVWGPRFFIPVLPAFAPAIAAALRRWPRSRWIAATALASVTMSLLGVWVTTHPELNQYVGGPVKSGSTQQIMAEFTSRPYVSHTDHIMFDWSLFPFRD